MGSCLRLARAVSNVKEIGIQDGDNVHLNAPGRSGNCRRSIEHGMGSGCEWAL